MDTPLLWHIPLSHFNEKARWALDYKGIAHRRQVLGPEKKFGRSILSAPASSL
jgi:hypothetical protein